MPREKKAAMFAKMLSREDALKVASDCGNGFFAIAALQGAASFLLGSSLLIDAALFAICGFFIRFKQSRAASVIGLLLAGVVLVTTFLNKGGQNFGGGTNIILALIIAWVAIRSVESTFKLHGEFKGTVNAPQNTQQGAPSDVPAAASRRQGRR